ncbi:MAG TPA: peptidylprolyl isomerase [Candidatus Saccharimonadales bacterium]|jgi:peptidyl-prolyl cis-trans isomerase A (cyclophilin A)|nr:peptidylprolyl isomerase [Candidatus Saccharimonadales bacterium]
MLKRVVLVVWVLTLAAASQTAPKPAAQKTARKSATKAAVKPKLLAAQAVILHTTAGDMKCQLFPDKAPAAVDNFVGLATGKKDWTNPVTGKPMHAKPLYDGVIFHRVIPEFMIQGGDPAGNGSGSPGYHFDDELVPDLLFDKPGRLAMANSGPNTNGSQFFITEKEVSFLNPCLEEGGCIRGQRRVSKGSGYTIFGQCDDPTVELVKKIARMPCTGGPCTGGNSSPVDPVKIVHIEVPELSKPPLKKAAPVKPAARPAASGAPKKP